MSQSSSVYGMAYGVKGFRRGGRKTSHVRVRIERMDERYIWVRTADLCDAGTPLVLDRSQVELEDEWTDEAVRHKDGLVTLD